ncbi:hypothetical protein AGLY_001155 [Aphis glycines]|uniref:DDE Tnp4 domain-containing protein n=1 Tax=Aphis glycines TaxID=307491 RepID=A0A6G0UBA9_APHGL|nr:hypothetical protein AGLY_001155 [Aphis glycines]
MNFENEILFYDDDVEFQEYLNYQRRPYTVRTKVDHFSTWDELDFKNRFRLSKETVLMILNMIGPTISSNADRNHAITPTQKLLLALRFYATGYFLISAGRWRCYGCGPNAEYFRNRKGWFSLNVQTVVSPKLKIMDTVVRWPGSTHDSTIFSHSKINNDLHVTQNWGNSLIVADSGYACNTMHIVTPFLNPHAGPENLYNESQIRTRNPVERCYGVWKINIKIN